MNFSVPNVSHVTIFVCFLTFAQGLMPAVLAKSMLHVVTMTKPVQVQTLNRSVK